MHYLYVGIMKIHMKIIQNMQEIKYLKVLNQRHLERDDIRMDAKNNLVRISRKITTSFFYV